MLQRLLNLIAGNYNDRQIDKIRPIVARINALYEERMSLSDADIKKKTEEFKYRISKGESLDALLPEAFATVKQACRRLVGQKYMLKGFEKVWNMIPYDVQLIGGVILHQGKIAEMKTGEGKTLVASLPAYLNALTGQGVHVVTVNDYLASRDAQQMGFLYERLGVSVGCVTKETPLYARRAEYAKDITYVENSELGFDYLRDNLVKSIDQRQVLWRPLTYAIVDEVDSILIDEARTPLIISEPDEEPTDKYVYYAKIVRSLVPAKGKKKVSRGFLAELLAEKEQTDSEDDQSGDYFIDEKAKTALLSSQGIAKLEKMLGVENLYRDLGYEEIHHIENALKALSCYQRDREYIVRDGEVLIVDEHTGRVMPGRRFSEGLHQAIEAKEGLEIKRESKTLATITYQNFFKLYKKLAGMTGTAATEGEEFDKIYGLEVLSVPTNKPMIRVDKPDRIYFDQHAKWQKIMEDIDFIHGVGQPILIGTSSIQTSEYVSSLLTKKNIPHYVLNAKYHEQEAKIIANAGKFGSVVVATNMAGRGTDIQLEPGLHEKIALKYAERLKSKKWKREWDDKMKQRSKVFGEQRQIIGVCAFVYSAIEAELTRGGLCQVFGFSPSDWDAKSSNVLFTTNDVSLRIVVAKKQKQKTDPYATFFFTDINLAKEAGVYSPNHTYPRDLYLEKDFHYGLFILGTEKHESRRIDNQLRGRAGRQGDPGVSVFYVALDDSLMRKMGGEKIQAMARFLLPKEQLAFLELTQKQFTSSITRAQKQMEAWHFSIRKHLFDYDSVIDIQRQAIYKKRDEILFSLQDSKEEEKDQDKEISFDIRKGDTYPKIYTDITSFCPDVAGSFVQTYQQMQTSSDDFVSLVYKEFGILLSQEEYETNKDTLDSFIATVFQKKLEQLWVAYSFPEQAKLFWTQIYLSILDKYRVDHIDDMHRLREKVGLMGYAQIDPLIVYKKEAFEKYQSLLLTIKQETLKYIFFHSDKQGQFQENIILENQEAQQLVEKLKSIAGQIKQVPQQQIPIFQTNQTTQKILQQTADIDVIEIDETLSRQGQKNVSDSVDFNKKKIRPNDKVTVQYQDGTFVYDVKYKKIEEDIKAGKCKIIG